MLGTNKKKRNGVVHGWPLHLFAALTSAITAVLSLACMGGILSAAADSTSVCGSAGLGGQTPGCYPNGSLLEGSDPSVWLIWNGKYFGVRDGYSIDCMGGWGAVQHKNDNQVAAMKQLYQYGGDYVCYPSGTMLQGADASVWLVAGGGYWGVTNGDMVNCLGGWNAVRHISGSDANSMRVFYPFRGDAVCYPDGAMIKGSDASVWLIQARKYLGVSDGATINCHGGWGNVRWISDSQLSAAKAIYGFGGTAGCQSSGDPRTAGAVAWAVAQDGKSVLPDGTQSYWMCERFTELTYGTSGQHGSAMIHYNRLASAGRIHYDRQVPYGGLVFYNNQASGGDGHTMINVGGDDYVTAGDNYVHHAHLGDYDGYLGWAWADPSWPGR